MNVISSFWSKPLIWILVSFPSLLVPCTFSFISLSIAFTFSSILQPYSTYSVGILITSVLISASNRLAISSSLSCIFSGAFCVFFLGCGTVLGGQVWEGTVSHVQPSAGFQSLLPLRTIKFGPSCANYEVGGFVYILGPCGSLQWTFLSGWEFLPLLQPSQVFQSEVLRVYFSTLEPWVAWSVSLPTYSSQFIHIQMWDYLLCQLLPLPVCPLLPCLSRSSRHHLATSPLCLAAHLCPSYRSGWMFIL